MGIEIVLQKLYDLKDFAPFMAAGDLLVFRRDQKKHLGKIHFLIFQLKLSQKSINTLTWALQTLSITM